MMFKRTKLLNDLLRTTKFFLLIFFLFAAAPTYSQQRQYSIDDSQNDRKERVSIFHKIRVKLYYLFKEDRQAKADRKKAKQEARQKKKSERAIRKYQKQQGEDKEITGGRKVSKRMKKMKKESERVNNDKPRDNFFKRLFSKNRQKRTKFKK